MKKAKNTARRGLLAFATRSYPKFGRQRRPFDAANPPQTVIDSPYYWWYQFLRLNKDYAATCKRGGRGHLSSLYRDFGDVFVLDFKAWWTPRDHLFAEPRSAGQSMVVQPASIVASDDNKTYRNMFMSFSISSTGSRNRVGRHRHQHGQPETGHKTYLWQS